MRVVVRVVVSVACCACSVAACANDSPVAPAGRAPSTPAAATAPPTTGGGAPATTQGGAPATAGEPAPESVTVQSIDNSFRPERLEISAGTEVVWVNRGRNAHDIESDFGFGVTADEFAPGDEYRYVFTEPGEYPYYCTIHGTETAGMIGTVVVTDSA
jgi:plastocyanin